MNLSSKPCSILPNPGIHISSKATWSESKLPWSDYVTLCFHYHYYYYYYQSISDRRDASILIGDNIIKTDIFQTAQSCSSKQTPSLHLHVNTWNKRERWDTLLCSPLVWEEARLSLSLARLKPASYNKLCASRISGRRFLSLLGIYF